MKYIKPLLVLLFLVCKLAFGQKHYRLAPPIAKYESLFFKEQTHIHFFFRQQGAVIRYTADGTEPNEFSAVYTEPVVVNEENHTIKAKVFGNGFEPSETISYTFYTIGEPFNISSNTPPASQYKGKGIQVLSNHQSGSSSFADGEWLGFDSDSIVLHISLMQPENINSITVHALQNQRAWIFLPKAIKIYKLQNDDITILNEMEYEPKPMTQSGGVALQLKLSALAKDLRMVLFPVNPIPEWHAGSGTKAWIFLDEVIVE